ncbi:MAG TPA: toxin-antitoxin system YwqK family antitoxin [Brumimicrobium sp.]|nr:toxin-antitoxin system YwqK family antitoxin [Brumimicrobium sp.]
MIKRIFTLLLLLCSPFMYAQISNDGGFGNKRGPCFQKSVDRIGKQYVEWECDDYDNIVDCNESLESDPGNNLVLTRSTGSPFTGDCETCHQNGLRERIVHFVNGKTDGIDTTFYQSGCPQVVRNHIEGVENGTWTFYNDTSGLIAWNINYFNGEKHGQSIFYNQHPVGREKLKVMLNGVERFIEYTTYENDTAKIEFYNNGLLEGTKKEYWPGSKIRREVNYKQGVFHGVFIEYDPGGNVMQELNYDLGKKDGNWKYYYNDGSLLKTENWKKDVKEGEFKTFYIQGFIQTMETYRKGQKHGEFMERFPDDKIKREAIYKKDVLVEEHVYDKYGNEIRTVGVDQPHAKTEDDEIPTTKKQQKKIGKKKEKKEKKEKKRKSKKSE